MGFELRHNPPVPMIASHNVPRGKVQITIELPYDKDLDFEELLFIAETISRQALVVSAAAHPATITKNIQ